MESYNFIAILIFYPMIGALVSYLIGKKSKMARNIFANVVTISEFVAVLLFTRTAPGGLIIKDVCGMGLSFSWDGFRIIYATVVAFMWMMTTLFCVEYFGSYRNRNRFYLFQLLTLGATMGVFLASDFYTVFIFFEMMSLTSYAWVAHDEKKESMRAAETYLGISVLGGLVMLMGIFMLWNACGTLSFASLSAAVQSSLKPGQVVAAGVCILFGFAVKAGAFPVHIWLPKAHPVAPAPASALLSGVLTKTGIFGIIAVTLHIFSGNRTFGVVLLCVALATMLLGAVMALFSVDIKRILACSSLSQIGFILTGVALLPILGEEAALAARGTLIYMVSHSMLKLVLFMIAGVVVMNTHKLNINEVRGFGRKKPLLNIAFLFGVLGISGVPLFNGYIGKTLLHEAILEASLSRGVEMVFLLSGGFTLAYMLKLYIAIFIEKNMDAKVQETFDAKNHYWTIPSAIAVLCSAAVLPVLGVIPQFTADKIMDLGQAFLGCEHFGEKVAYFALHNMKGSLISLFIGVVIYVLFVRVCLMKETDLKTNKGKAVMVYKDYWPKWLDLENMIYRPLIVRFLPFITGIICRVLDGFVDTIVVILKKTLYRERKLPHELPEGNIFTLCAGMVVDFFTKIWNRTVRRNKEPLPQRHVHRYAILWEEFGENNQIIARSLSYGLLIFCLGLVMTLVYLICVIIFK